MQFGYVQNTVLASTLVITKTPIRLMKFNRYLLLCFLLALSLHASAVTYFVSTTGDNTRTPSEATNSATPWLTINFAISQASAGDEIRVLAGTYTESILVNKGVQLVGDNKPVLIGSSADPAIVRVASTGVTIRGFRMEVNQADVLYGVQSTSSNVMGLTIEDNEILGSAFAGNPNCIQFPTMGILLDGIGNSGYIIRRNIIFVKTTLSCVFGRGIRVVGGSGIIGGSAITDSNLIAASIPIQIGAPTSVMNIRNNHCYGRGVQFVDPVANSGLHTIADNRFDGGRPSVTLSLVEIRGITNNNTSLEVNNNVFSNFAYYGLLSSRANNVTIAGNTFTPYDTTTYIAIGLNTKQLTDAFAVTQSAFVNGATILANTFNPPATVRNGGAGIILYNHNNNSSFGTVTIGNSSQRNTFNAGIRHFVLLDTNSGFSKQFRYFESEIIEAVTAMSPVTANLNVDQNLFDIGNGPQRPCSMSSSELVTLEDHLYHSPDKPGLGTISYPTTVPPVITGPTTLCAGGFITLTTNYVLQPNEFYLWSTNTINQNLTVLAPGTYTLRIGNATTGCTTAVSNAIVVTTATIPTPTITGPAVLCFRSNVTLTTNYTLQPNESFLWSDNSTGSSLLVTSAGNYSLRVVNSVLSCTSAFSNVITVNVVTCPNTKVFVGFVDNQWLRNGNWEPSGIPTATDSVVIPVNAFSYPTITGGVGQANGFLLQSGASLSISADDSLVVRRSLTLGTNITGEGSLVLRGSALQVFPGTSISRLVVDNPANVRLSNNLSVTGNIRVLRGALDVNNRTVTLVSNASGTGALGSAQTGAFLNANNVVTQRWFNPAFVPSAPRYGTWNYVTAPVSGLTVNHWSANNPYAVFTYDGTQPINSSVWLYDAFNTTRILNNGYVKPSAPSDPAGRGVGLRIFFRTTPFYSSGGTIQATGAPFLGEHTYSLQYCPSGCAYPTSQGGNTFNGFNLVGNPYMGPIDWDHASWTRTNIAGSIWVWRESLQGFASYLSGVGGVNGATQYIPHHQGFFVETTAPGASLTVRPGAVAAASTAQAPTFFRQQGNGELRMTISQAGYQDEMLLVDNPTASRQYQSGEDAHKMMNGGVNLAMETPVVDPSREESHRLCISSYPLSQNGALYDTIPLYLKAHVTGEIRLLLTTMTIPGKTIYLWDRTSGARYLVNLGGEILLQADSSATTQYALLLQNNLTSISGANVLPSFRVYPNPAHQEVRLLLNGIDGKDNSPAYELHNQLGAVVRRGVGTTINLEGLAAGLYTVAVPGYGRVKVVVR